MGNQNTLKNFNEQQKKATNLLNKLNSIVKEGLDLGVEFSLGVQNKLESVVGMIQNGNRLKVALIGGFLRVRLLLQQLGWKNMIHHL